MALYQPPIEEPERETHSRAIGLLVAEVASLVLAIAIVVLLVTQPWGDGWSIEPQPGPGILSGSGDNGAPKGPP